MSKFDTATGTAISPSGTKFAMVEIDQISNKPIFRQITKSGQADGKDFFNSLRINND